MIQNPILRGFCPDPSILRVGGDYYIAVSTFEWWPGVRIYHSANLADWRLIAAPLRRKSQIDLTGDPVNGGVWAPCLSYHDGEFFLAYSDMKCQKRPCHSGYNYAAKTRDIAGEWSDGAYINASGFDPSIFHDPSTGKSYWLNMRHGFRGVLLWEFDRETLAIKGDGVNICRGMGFGTTEGPHLYYRDGWYYLVAAEGGTGYGHCVSVARSRDIWGGYEPCPHNPVLTSDKGSRLQKAGHASFVETAEGDWFMAHLCSRPFGGKSVLGRETAIQPMEWADGWPRLKGGGNAPLDSFEYKGLSGAMAEGEPYSYLRSDPGDDVTVVQDGGVTMIGREGFLSNFRVSAAARRVRELPFTAEAALAFEAEQPEQAAGLLLMYNNENAFAFVKTCDEDGKPTVTLGKARNRQFEPLASAALPAGALELRVTMDAGLAAAFEYKTGGEWQALATYDASWLCDEDAPGFTGLHAALYCEDRAGLARQAAFPSGLTINS